MHYCDLYSVQSLVVLETGLYLWQKARNKQSILSEHGVFL